MRKIILISIVGLFSFTCIAQKVISGSKIIGVYTDSAHYQKIIILRNKSFYVTRIPMGQSPHAFTIFCDTMAKGKWRLFNSSNIILSNNKKFNTIDYQVREDTIGSKDSVYFKVVLPQEDALDYRKFQFSIFTNPSAKIIKFSTSVFAISKKTKEVPFYSYNFCITSISPNNCSPGEKCYQRIYFNVFENYHVADETNNFFTITLPDFNQCFYEAMDIENEVLILKQNNIFWRGRYFRRLTNN